MTGPVQKPTKEHPCPKGDGCALNKGAVTCFHCGRNWPPDRTWDYWWHRRRDDARVFGAAR